MKMTIDAINYDTQTATLVARFSNEGGSALRALVEKLYLSPNGRWFLHGEGGASTEYAQHHADCITAGERITPMTEEEALDWCELNLAQVAIERHFGHLTQDA